MGGTTYTVNNANQLTAVSGSPNTTFTCDNNGNTATKVEGTGTSTYTWNSENKLKQVSLPGGATVTFKYDPFGRRVQKVSASGTVNILYDGANVIEELDSTGAVIGKYAQGRGIDQPMAMLRGGTTSYYEADALGSLSSLTDNTGTIANSYSYDAYGKLNSSSGTLQNPFRYTGREFDNETGSYYYRTRYFDTGVGRFLSEDAIRFDGGTNFYRYVNNGPLNWTDPLGLSAKDVQNMIEQFNKAIDRMNAKGERRPGSGRPNGWLNDFLWHNWPWSPKDYKSCGEQAYEVEIQLNGGKYDDEWEIKVVRIELGLGQAVRAQSKNPSDPVIIFDPWLNSITPMAPPNPATGVNSLEGMPPRP